MGDKSKYTYHSPSDGKPRQDESVCCSQDCLRFSTHLFNFLLFLTGIALSGVGLWTIIVKDPSLVLLTSGLYDVIAYALIIMGLFVLVLSIMGCCGISKRSPRLMLIYSICLVIMILAEAAIGALAYCYRDYINSELRVNLFDKYQREYGNEDSITKAIDQLQVGMKCCGVDSFEDWKKTEWWNQTDIRQKNLVPDSCCLTPSAFCGVRDHPSNIRYTGCIDRIGKIASDHMIIIGAVSLGVCIIQIFGVCLSCLLHRKMKKMEHYV
ncbi:CD151 antigen [Lepeophtheirus salmonis]|uniref:Tetraspanin n=1 Tax=Lepeophtheirus salmonis TaxID=72036 RepID=A0A0K2TX70_LEPSM|nr:CD151 antigen-like [Lepeophtheirus salmonis]